MIDVICAVIAAMSAIIVSAIGANMKKSERRADEQAELRRKESLLSLRMMDATLQLSVVTSNALTGGHNNGNVEKAREAASKAASDYEEFMRQTTVREISK